VHSDLWVAGDQCQGCGRAASFNPSSSSSLQTSQQPIDLQYGSGEAQGNLVQDVVSMGGFTIQKQQFVLAEDVSEGLLQGSLSGLMGLGFEAIAQTQYVSLINAMIKTHFAEQRHLYKLSPKEIS
jgi:cathepsin D